MVRQLYGRCDGQEIIFRLVEAGRWEATVPASPTGTYIVELWVEDEAGNSGYCATIEVTYDSSNLCCRVTVLEVGAAFTPEEVLHLLRGDGVSWRVELREVSARLTPDRVRSQIVKCEVCGI